MLDILLFLGIGIIAGFFGELAGGAPTIVLPFLLLLGVPIKSAVASTAVAVLGLQCTSVVLEYWKNKLDVRLGIFLSFFAVLGSFVGAHFLLNINETSIKTIAWILVGIALLLLILRWKFIIKERHVVMTKTRYLLGGMLGFIVGAYGAFFGAGVGIFNIYLFVGIFGKSIFSSLGLRKMILLFTFLTSSVVFLFSNAVDFSITVPLLVSMVVGALVGSRFIENLERKISLAKAKFK